MKNENKYFGMLKFSGTYYFWYELAVVILFLIDALVSDKIASPHQFELLGGTFRETLSQHR